MAYVVVTPGQHRLFEHVPGPPCRRRRRWRGDQPGSSRWCRCRSPRRRSCRGGRAAARWSGQERIERTVVRRPLQVASSSQTPTAERQTNVSGAWRPRGSTRRCRCRSRPRRIRPPPCAAHGGRGRERIGRTGASTSGAGLVDVADARRRAADGRARLEGVGRTGRARAGAVLGDVADAGRRSGTPCVARREARRPDTRRSSPCSSRRRRRRPPRAADRRVAGANGVGRTAVARAGAALGHVADAGRRAADGRARLERVGRAVARRPGAVLGDVADAGRGAADRASLGSNASAGQAPPSRCSSRRRRRRPPTARQTSSLDCEGVGRARRAEPVQSRRRRTRRPTRGTRRARLRTRRPGTRRSSRCRSRRRRRRRPTRGTRRARRRSASAGHAAVEPVQFSATSQTPADARQTVVAGYEGVGRAQRASSRCSSRRRRRRPPTARQTVVLGSKPSAGHAAVEPVQLSATSQTPASRAADRRARLERVGRTRRRRARAALRDVADAGRGAADVVSRAKPSAGHAALEPVQVSATSQTPADARHTVVTAAKRVRRARRGRAGAVLGDVAGARRRAATSWSARRRRPDTRGRAGAVLGDVADAGRRAADRGGRLERVGRTRRARAGAVLGDVADARRRAAHRRARARSVGRTGGARAGAVLGDVADARRSAARPCCSTGTCRLGQPRRCPCSSRRRHRRPPTARQVVSVLDEVVRGQSAALPVHTLGDVADAGRAAAGGRAGRRTRPPGTRRWCRCRSRRRRRCRPKRGTCVVSGRNASAGQVAARAGAVLRDVADAGRRAADRAGRLRARPAGTPRYCRCRSRRRRTRRPTRGT